MYAYVPAIEINDDFAEQFGKRLKELRKTNNITQGRAAAKTGVSRNTWDNYENGKNVPNVVFLERVTMLFGVSAAFLMGH